jgi:hypothetical protein
MAAVTSFAESRGMWAEVAEWMRSRPATVLALVLALHLLIWIAVPLVVADNLRLDLVEDLALGKEWQLGYWKHPPLPWWFADAFYRLIPDVRVVYMLGPLSMVVCMWAVWGLGCMVVSRECALIAVLALEGTHYYNFSSVMYAHDQCQSPFWALTGWFVYRAITGQRALDWSLSGVVLAGAFWSKYAAFVLAGTVFFVLVLDPEARKAWRTAGPYLMGLSFAVVIAPQAWWLATTGFQPFSYVEQRAPAGSHWYEHIVLPLRWTANQLGGIAPTLGLIAILVLPAVLRSGPSGYGGFPRRYVTALALGPFLLTTGVSLLTGRQPVAMWGYPFWSFAPLAILMWLEPRLESTQRRLPGFAMAFAGVFALFPLAYGINVFGVSLVSDHPHSEQFQGQLLADTVTQAFRERTQGPLVYVGGDEFFSNNVAVYSADRPHVIVDGDLKKSPWVDPKELAKRGAVIFPDLNMTEESRNDLLRSFPGAELQQALFLPRKTVVPRTPIKIDWAIVPPQL